MNNSNTDFTYLSTGGLDDDLFCNVCEKPLDSPYEHKTKRLHTINKSDLETVRGCHKIFCRKCIFPLPEDNIKLECPGCDVKFINKADKVCAFDPVNTKIILDKVDNLQVRCNVCELIMTRSAFYKHDCDKSWRQKVNGDITDLKEKVSKITKDGFELNTEFLFNKSLETYIEQQIDNYLKKHMEKLEEKLQKQLDEQIEKKDNKEKDKINLIDPIQFKIYDILMTIDEFKKRYSDYAIFNFNRSRFIIAFKPNEQSHKIDYVIYDNTTDVSSDRLVTFSVDNRAFHQGTHTSKSTPGHITMVGSPDLNLFFAPTYPSGGVIFSMDLRKIVYFLDGTITMDPFQGTFHHNKNPIYCDGFYVTDCGGVRTSNSKHWNIYSYIHKTVKQYPR